MSAPRTQTCRLCGAPSHFIFRQALLDREVDYFDCAACGYMQTEQPTWLEQAYSSAINAVDTGIMARSQLNARRVALTLLAMGCLDGRVIDHAGGYGILVRLLRDMGIDARWSDKYCDNLVARGFEAAAHEACDLLTAFEVFEHLEHPMAELQTMLGRAPAVLISTELAPDGPVARDWWYLGPEHGQHIGFFRRLTLEHMAARLGCRISTDAVSLHLFSRRPIPARWHLLQRARRLAPLLLRGRLRSRTQDDFEQLRRQY